MAERNGRAFGLIEVINVLIGIVVAIFCVGSIPFANDVTGRLASIEAELKTQAVVRARLDKLEASMLEVQLHIAREARADAH